MNDKNDYIDEKKVDFELTQALANSLIQSSDLIDVACDYSENLFKSIATTTSPNIDNIFNSPWFNSIPFFKTVAAVGKTIYSIHYRNLLIQTYSFIQELNAGGELSEKGKKHLELIQNDKKECSKELGRVLILLDKNIDEIKSYILARFLRAYFEGKISWDKFCELSDITDRIFVSDIELLKSLSNGVKGKELTYQHDRLISLGVLSSPFDHRGAIVWNGEDDVILNLSELGKLFCELLD